MLQGQPANKLSGAMWRQDGKRKESLQLRLKYQHAKSRCKMLIGRDDISNDIITLGVCFHLSFQCLVSGKSDSSVLSFREENNLTLISRKSDSSVDGEPQGNRTWNSNSRDVVVSSPPYSPPTPRDLAHRLLQV